MRRFFFTVLFLGSALFGPLPAQSLRVAIFVSPTCPICQYYTGPVNALVADFPGVDWEGYAPEGTSRKAVRKFQRVYGWDLPVRVDRKGQNAQAWGARKTPEAFVWVDDRLVYRGRIDNAWVELGRKRGVVTENDLREVLEAFGRGEELEFREMEAVGCLIE